MHQRMSNAETGDLIATQEVIEVFFDVADRTATAMPGDIRTKLQDVLAAAD